MRALDLKPGDVLTGKLGGERKATKRLVTHVLARTPGLTRFRTVKHGTNPNRSGEVWELPSLLGLKGDHGKAPKVDGTGVGVLDRARMDDRTAFVLATWGRAVPIEATA